MPVKVVCVGKLKEQYFRDAQQEYVKRLSRLYPTQIVEVADEREPETLSPALIERVKQREGERILARLSGGEYVIALCVDAHQMSSEGFAKKLSSLFCQGRGDIAFVIGGSLGLSNDVIERADIRLSIGGMTLPHQLCRVVLLEQIYRAAKINSGERYHK